MTTMSTTKTQSRFRHPLLLKCLILASVLLIIIGCCYYYWLSRPHVVIRGEIYRSAQLSQAQLQDTIQKYHIQSVINLRGIHEARWYNKEVAVAAKMGITHYDTRLDATQLPTLAALQALVNTLLNAKKPLLLHCRSGADRSGLASAISLILQNETSIEHIKEQYSWKFWVASPSSVGKLLMPYYFSWLNKNHFISSKEHFIFWVNNEYGKVNHP